MAIVETEALVLRTYNFGEADKIVVCLTHKAGLVRAVAKGCRKLKSKFGAALEPFARAPGEEIIPRAVAHGTGGIFIQRIVLRCGDVHGDGAPTRWKQRQRDEQPHDYVKKSFHGPSSAPGCLVRPQSESRAHT